jgi:glutathione synthase/RimK-type ligase-like ATP-grasp enzyme
LQAHFNQEIKMRIGIIQTYEPGERWGYGMGLALQSMGADWIPIEARYLKAVVNECGAATLLIEGDPGIQEESLDQLGLDGIVWRVSEADFDNYLDIYDLLCQHYTVVNDWQCTWICSDKWRTSAKLATAGITVVPTVLLTPGMQIPEFPGHKTIIKPSVGASGNGVRLAKAGTALEMASPHVAQPLVIGPSSTHIRVIVCGQQPVASIHRIPGPEHAGNEIEINNIAAGGAPVPAPMELVHDLATQVARCIDGDIIGIDLVPWNGGFAVLEVNSSPGFNGIDEALGIDCFYLSAEQALRRFRSATEDTAHKSSRRMSNT